MGRVADKDRVDWGSGRVEQGGRKRHKVEVEAEQGRDKRSSHLKLVCGSLQLPRRNLTNFFGAVFTGAGFCSFFTGVNSQAVLLPVASGYFNREA